MFALALLLWVEHRFQQRRGQSFALYIVIYTFGRFWFENMRIDTAHHVAGLRINAWVALALFLFGIGYYVWLGRHEIGAAESDAAAAARTAGEPAAVAPPDS